MFELTDVLILLSLGGILSLDFHPMSSILSISLKRTTYNIKGENSVLKKQTLKIQTLLNYKTWDLLLMRKYIRPVPDKIRRD